jgi:nitroreductase
VPASKRKACAQIAVPAVRPEMQEEAAPAPLAKPAGLPNTRASLAERCADVFPRSPVLHRPAASRSNRLRRRPDAGRGRGVPRPDAAAPQRARLYRPSGAASGDRKLGVRTAGSAPSGANHQPWHFVAISDPALKARIRAEAEDEERRFYEGGGGDEWIRALEPIGTNADKPHLTIAPWLIVVFAQRWGTFERRHAVQELLRPRKRQHRHRLPACRTASRRVSATLTHTPNPMKFLNGALDRPDIRKAVDDHRRGPPRAGRHGAGGGQAQEAARRNRDLPRIGHARRNCDRMTDLVGALLSALPGVHRHSRQQAAVLRLHDLVRVPQGILETG